MIGNDGWESIATDIIDRYVTDGIDVVHLAYANFRSTMVQEPVVDQIIPVPPRKADRGPDFAVAGHKTASSLAATSTRNVRPAAEGLKPRDRLRVTLGPVGPLPTTLDSLR